MTTATRGKIIGDSVDRIDGPLKVTGAARYPSDFTFPDLTHAVLVQSTIANGTVRGIDAAKAEAAPGVLAVITHENAPALVEAPMTPQGPSPPFPFTDNRILHQGQHVAVVVARTREQAAAAARLLEIDYEAAAPVLGIDDPRAPVLLDRWGQDVDRGDVTAALAFAEVVYDETFTTAAVTNNPMGLFATVARWDGNRLTVHDANQWPMMVRTTLATVFDVPETEVRVLVPYLGGGFGAGLRAWPHVILTALAARVVGRPVKLVLTRPQMFTSVGHRPESLQRVQLGAAREGRLVLRLEAGSGWRV
jgi:CO/xanthine dehydrogenase Mo-binding subunit